MIWEIEWAGPVIFGYEFDSFLAQGIDEWVKHSDYCDGCGNFRIVEIVNIDGGRELLPYKVCSECRNEMEDRPHVHTCQQCDKPVGGDCYCEKGNTTNVWCSANCKAAYDL